MTRHDPLTDWERRSTALIERRYQRNIIIGRIIFDWVIPIACAAALAGLWYAVT